MGVGQLSESDAVDALRLPFYSSSHPTGSHGWRNQFDLGNPDQIFLSLGGMLAHQQLDPSNFNHDAEYASAMQEFISRANGLGIAVHAMTLEDPSFSFSTTLPQALTLVDHIIAFCDGHPDSPFSGIHVDTEPHDPRAWQSQDLSQLESIMRQYLRLLERVRSSLDNSGLALELSASIAWWYNDQARNGNLPSGDAASIGQRIEVLVPMVYDGIGETVQSLISRSEDEIEKAPTLIGIGASEFRSYTDLASAIDSLNEHFAGMANYQGVSIYDYQALRQLPGAP